MVIPRLLQGWGRYAGSPVSPLQRSTIVSAYQQGTGVGATRDILRSQGMGIRLQAIREIRREIGGAPERLRGYRFLRPDFRPSETLYTKTKTNLRTKYKYWGRLTARIPGLAEEYPINVSFGSDELLSRREIEERLREVGEGYRRAYGATTDTLEVTGLDLRDI